MNSYQGSPFSKLKVQSRSARNQNKSMDINNLFKNKNPLISFDQNAYKSQASEKARLAKIFSSNNSVLKGRKPRKRSPLKLNINMSHILMDNPRDVTEESIANNQIKLLKQEMTF